MSHAERVKEGATIFRINCSHCHGASGIGEGPVSVYLKEKPVNLRQPDIQSRSEAALYDIVTNGKDVMPSFKGELSMEERWSVAAYVKSFPEQ
jgi:high-affinity iron transporter